MYEKINVTHSKHEIVPQKRVLNILNFVRNNFDFIDHRLRADWIFVIRKVSSGKLYDVDFDSSNQVSSNIRTKLNRWGLTKKITSYEKRQANNTGM